MTKKYEATSDIMAEVDAPAEMEVQAHYGKLQWIFRIEVPQSPQLHLDKPQTLCLAAIKDCVRHLIQQRWVLGIQNCRKAHHH